MNGVIANDMSAGITCSKIIYGHNSAVPTVTCIIVVFINRFFERLSQINNGNK